MEDNRAITTIRVDLNGKGLNNILAKLYYLLYGMYDTNAPAAELFSEEALYQMVYTEGEDVTLKDGTVVKSVNAHGKCVFYLQTFASNMIGKMTKFKKICPDCGCEFEYEQEDVKVDYSVCLTTYPPKYNTYIVCLP